MCDQGYQGMISTYRRLETAGYAPFAPVPILKKTHSRTTVAWILLIKYTNMNSIISIFITGSVKDEVDNDLCV